MGYLMALTGNSEINEYAINKLGDQFGENGAFRLVSSDEMNDPEKNPDEGLFLITAAAHHFTTSTFANQPELLQREGAPFVEIHPDDAAARGIAHDDVLVVENERGWCELTAKVTDGVRSGVLASPKGYWSKLGNGRNVNWTTSDALGDMAGQSTFHSNRVWVRKK